MVQAWPKAILRGALIFLAFMLAGKAQVPALNDPLTPAERAWLAAHPTIRLAVDPEYQPIEYFDEQKQYRGIVADYLALLEQRLGLRFQTILIPLEKRALTDPLELGVDARAISAATPERQEKWFFSLPYLEFPAYLITRDNVSDEVTLDQLASARIAVVADYAAREYLTTRHPKLSLDPVTDTRTGLRKVVFGLADGFVSDLPVATYWMEQEGSTNLKLTSAVGYVNRMGFATRKDWPELHAIVEKGLASVTPEERTAIYSKWVKMPTAQALTRSQFGLVLLVGFSLVGLGLAGVWWWNRSLAARVNQRTAALEQELRERKQAEEQLHISEERFAAIFRSSPNPLAITRYGDNKFLEVNDRWVQLSGYEKTELLGQGEREKMLWEDPQVRQQIVELLRQQRPIRDFEFTYLTKSGERRTSLLSAETIKLDDELCSLWTVQDFTERKRAEEALQQSEALFRSLTETTTTWVFVVQDNIIRYMNSSAQAGIEYTREELLGANIWSFVHPDDVLMAKTMQYERGLKATIPLRYEHRAITKSGKVLWLEITTNPIPYQNGFAVLSTAIDITERKLAEQALQQSEELFRSLTETTTAWVYIVEDGQISYVNSAATTGLGYTREEMHSINILDVIHPDDLAWAKERLRARREGRAIAPIYEVRLLTKTGETRWLQVTTKPIQYHQALAVLNTGFDITERKQAEEKLKVSEQQLHQLAGYLQTVREEERTAIAREIHDELGQALTAMKMDLVWLNHRLSENQSALQSRIAGIIALINDTINTVRKLATQLRPGVLDDLGLSAALEWQAQEFQARTGIECEFDEAAEIPVLAPEQATAIFRICQEALTNVARHANATKVYIQLQIEQNRLALIVKDNGRGLTESELVNPRSLGLLGMNERVFLLGGEFSIQGRPNGGTTVIARIPLTQSKAKVMQNDSSSGRG